jgi:metal-responsive CopG/Arc/MetJ family transcriptional regulator
MEKIRVQFDFNKKALQELDQLKNQLGVTSRADVVRFSLRIMQWMVQEYGRGSRVMVERDGTLHEVVFPFLAIAPPVSAAGSTPARAAAASAGD